MKESETAMPEAAILVNASALINLSLPNSIFFAQSETEIMAVIAQGKDAEEEIERVGIAPTVLVDGRNRQTVPVVVLTFSHPNDIQDLIGALATLKSHIEARDKADA
ncbi:hypothetical protein GCM10022631_29920 [Deinococcus rubellus]|uniref:hypothetical protein n=1 Tax=Deinococcus rubellus TaxID=1889240 RepID=UPI0031E6896F